MCRCEVHRGVVSAFNMYMKDADGAIAQKFPCQRKKSTGAESQKSVHPAVCRGHGCSYLSSKHPEVEVQKSQKLHCELQNCHKKVSGDSLSVYILNITTLAK